MSEQRLSAAGVRDLVDELVAALSPLAERVEIGGSLRRGAEMVKDVELVVLNPTPAFFVRTDRMVASGEASKALYGGSFRWGQKYRGLVSDGVRFELFCADSDNFGYIYWLRTGPADANQFLVTRLKHSTAAFRVADGYVWHDAHKLHVPTEDVWFALIGLPLIAPTLRSIRSYAGLTQHAHKWGEPTPYRTVEPPAPSESAQLNLFDLPDEKAKWRYD